MAVTLVRFKRKERNPKKKRKTSDRKKLMNQCDELWRQIIKLQAKGKCQVCAYLGKDVPGRDSHHVVSRRHFATRWWPENGIHLCFTDHQPRGHDDPINFSDILVKILGEDKIRMLKERAKKVWQPKMGDLLAVKELLKIHLTKLEDG